MLTTKVKQYEAIVYPTVQKYWIEGKGRLLWLGLFFVELGAALFFVASLFDCLWGEILGWLIAGALGGGTHLLFLGHPSRVYRAFRRPKNSWISRGLILITLFHLFGLIHILLALFSASYLWLLIGADVFAAAAIAYGGYEVADVKPIRTWHSSFLPVQLFVRSITLAFVVMLAGYLLGGVDSIAMGIHVKTWINIAFIVNAAFFLIYPLNLAFDEGSRRLSLGMLLKGELKGIYWLWVTIGGMLLPLIIAVYSLVNGAEQIGAAILLFASVLQFVADPLLRYCSMRSGYYEGLFPCKPVEFPGAG